MGDEGDPRGGVLTSAVTVRRLAHAGAVADPVQQAILAELKAIRALLEQHARRPAPSLSRHDRAVLARVLPAIAGARGSEPFAFTSRDLRAAPALHVALRGFSVKQIGRLLARAENIPIDGWIVQRCGTEINVTLWRVVASVSHRLETGTAIARSDSIGRGESDV